MEGSESASGRTGRIREDVPMFTSKSMYEGSAGIGIFLIRLYEATSDERWAERSRRERQRIVIATQVGRMV